MNKSTLLFQLALPLDIINYICSFNFYSLEECIQTVKNNKKKISNYIKTLMVENTQYYNYNTIILHDENYIIKTQLHICRWCHNNIVVQTKMSIHGLCLCYRQDRIIKKLNDGYYTTEYT
jgi:hypothetical protein